MANTRKSSKRARQAAKRQDRNQIVRGATKGALKNALDALKSKDLTKAKETYLGAIRALGKAASKRALPKGRVDRKISRLTAFAKKVLPALFASASNKA